MTELAQLLKYNRQPTAGKEGSEIGWLPVGKLPLPSGSLWAGDPEFVWAELRSEDGFRTSLEAGEYLVSAFVMSFGKWHAIARLRVCQASVSDPVLGASLGEAGTDSGLIGVADASALAAAFAARFGDDEDEPPSFLSEFDFGRVGLLAPNGPSGAAMPYVNCGFGDGSGPVYQLRSGRKRVGVELVFIEPGATS